MPNNNNRIEKPKFRIACAEMAITNGLTDRNNSYMEEYATDIQIDVQC